MLKSWTVLRWIQKKKTDPFFTEHEIRDEQGIVAASMEDASRAGLQRVKESSALTVNVGQM